MRTGSRATRRPWHERHREHRVAPAFSLCVISTIHHHACALERDTSAVHTVLLHHVLTRAGNRQPYHVRHLGCP